MSEEFIIELCSRAVLKLKEGESFNGKFILIV